MFVAFVSTSLSSFLSSSSPAEDDDDNKFNEEEEDAAPRSTNVAAMDPIPIPISPLLRAWSPATTLLLLLHPTLLLLPTANAAAAAAVVVEEEEEKEEEETALGEADVLVAVAVLRSNLAVVVPRRRNDMYQ